MMTHDAQTTEGMCLFLAYCLFFLTDSGWQVAIVVIPPLVLLSTIFNNHLRFEKMSLPKFSNDKMCVVSTLSENSSEENLLLSLVPLFQKCLLKHAVHKEH